MSPIDGKPIDENYFNGLKVEALMKALKLDTPELALKYSQAELLSAEIILETKKNKKGQLLNEEQLSGMEYIVKVQKENIENLQKYIEVRGSDSN
ncbi:hypothetical protein [Bacillus sp. RC51]|uniref:hypothetical protein n=1 Tax=Bacillus sp. RC51 TaxID=3156288 RepID=UPI0038371275